MADRTTYHAGQGGTGKNGPAQSGVGQGLRGGGTAGQTDNTGGGRQMNGGHYSGQNRKPNYRKGQNRSRIGGGHQRGGMMQQGNCSKFRRHSTLNFDFRKIFEHRWYPFFGQSKPFFNNPKQIPSN